MDTIASFRESRWITCQTSRISTGTLLAYSCHVVFDSKIIIIVVIISHIIHAPTALRIQTRTVLTGLRGDSRVRGWIRPDNIVSNYHAKSRSVPVQSRSERRKYLSSGYVGALSSPKA